MSGGLHESSFMAPPAPSPSTSVGAKPTGAFTASTALAAAAQSVTTQSFAAGSGAHALFNVPGPAGVHAGFYHTQSSTNLLARRGSQGTTR